MSMILDALSRAEKERQAENNNTSLDDVRYVASSTIKEDRYKKWVLIALAFNFILLSLLAGGYVWKNYIHGKSDGSANYSDSSKSATDKTSKELPENTRNLNATQASGNSSLKKANTVEKKSANITSEASVSEQKNASVLINSSGLELSATSLQDEAKTSRNKSASSSANKTTARNTIKRGVKKQPPVQYSSEPLTQGLNNKKQQSDELTVADVTKALSANNKSGTSDAYTKLNDLPESQRTHFSQHEVNVHVYDNDPINRFVLINMVKYKEGDLISGSRTRVASIVPEGVVLKRNNQQVLIARN